MEYHNGILELIPEAGKFYKVNMHNHSDISDGKNSPEEVKALYKKLGYSAVCYTDHEILMDHRDLCDDEFIALHGYEVAVKQDEGRHTGYFQPVYHFNIIAKSQDNLTMPAFYKTNPSCAGNSRYWMDTVGQYSTVIDATHYETHWLNGYLKEISDGGFLVTYNHPQWSLQSYNDYIGLEHLHAIEVINGGCVPLNDNTSLHYEAMLRAGKKIIPVAGDDNHSESGVGHGWTMMKAPELTYEALMTAYEKGECYVSEGPEIQSLTLKDGKIIVKTSPASAVTLLTEGRYAVRVSSRTETYTEAEFDYLPEKFGSYFRIEVRDAGGYKAYSNAYYTDEIREKLEK